MQNILDWMLAKSANCFSFSEEDLRRDCEEILAIRLRNVGDAFEEVPDRDEMWAMMKQWQLDKEYLASLDLHILVAKHIRASCQVNGCYDSLDSWKVQNIDIDGISLAAELGLLIREKLRVQTPLDCEKDGENKVKQQFFLSPLDDFHKGLENFIGYPSLNDEIVAAMKMEHERDICFCDSKDRNIDPKVEWNIVVRSGKWKIEGVDYQPTPLIKKRHIGDDLAHFARVANTDYSHAHLNEAEIISLRLWTGPMYVKYAADIRENQMNRSGSESKRVHSSYANTLHAINSGITKLARVWKIPRDRKLYRGYNKLKMQQLQKDAFGCIGGVERAFLATSESFEVALSYSGDGAFVLEINVGQVNRGADISWLSQFPDEKEILFNALSNVEFLGNPQLRFVPDKGKIQVYRVEINSNSKSKTLEEYVHLRKDLHLNMTDVLVNQALRMVGKQKQASEHQLLRHLCSECEAYSDDIFRNGQQADVGLFNEGRQEYVGLVRDVINFQEQSLSMVNLAWQWFHNGTANPHQLNGLADWQLRGLKRAFKCCEPPELNILILDEQQQTFQTSVFHAKDVDLGAISTPETALVAGRLLSLNPNMRSLWVKAEWATAELWEDLFYEFAEAQVTDFCINGFTLSKYAIKTLQRLEVRNRQAEEAAMLAPALLHHPPCALRNLNLWRCPIGCAGAETLARAFHSISNLVNIGLPECMVGDRGCMGLAKTLTMLSGLRILDLSYNIIGDKGAKALKSALTDLAVLELVDMKCNKMTSNLSELGRDCKLNTNVLVELFCSKTLHSVAWSPDGSRITSGSEDGIITIWAAQMGEQKVRFKGHAGAVHSLGWSADGSKFASGSSDKDITIWDGHTGEQKGQLKGHSVAVLSVAWSSDGCKIASGAGIIFNDDPGELIIWNAQYGNKLVDLKGHTHAVTSVAWNTQGCKLASGSVDKSVIIWDVQTGEQRAQLSGHTLAVTSVVWSPEGSKIASGSADKTIIIWGAETEKQEAQINCNGGVVFSVAWSPEGSKIASGNHDHSLIVWDAHSQELKSEFKGHTHALTSVAWSPDGSRIVSCAGNTYSADPGEIIIWDAGDKIKVYELTGHTQAVTSVVWSPEGGKVASGSWDSTIIIWDARAGEKKAHLKGHSDTVRSVAWSPDGIKIASASIDNKIIVWDVETGEQKAELKRSTQDGLPIAIKSKAIASGSEVWNTDIGEQKAELRGQTFGITSLDWSPDGSHIVSGADVIIIWDADTGQPMTHLKGHKNGLTSVRWSPNGFNIASGSFDKTLMIWHAETGLQKAQLEGHSDTVRSVAWNPDGSNVASGSDDNTIIIWNVHTGEQKCKLEGHIDRVNSVAWSPEGSDIASGSDDNTIIIWDLHTGQRKSQLEGHTSTVWSVAWSPKGTQIASGSFDRSIIIWDRYCAEQKAQLKGHPDDVDFSSRVADRSKCKLGSLGRSKMGLDAMIVEDESHLSMQIDPVICVVDNSHDGQVGTTFSDEIDEGGGAFDLSGPFAKRRKQK